MCQFMTPQLFMVTPSGIGQDFTRGGRLGLAFLLEWALELARSMDTVGAGMVGAWIGIIEVYAMAEVPMHFEVGVFIIAALIFMETSTVVSPRSGEETRAFGAMVEAQTREEMRDYTRARLTEA